MKTTGLIFTVAAMTLIASRPAFADVVPPKSAKAAETSQVRDRLTTLGVIAPAAQSHVESLTAAELSFFAADSDRVQVVGGLHMTEWIFGVGLLLAFTFMYFGHISNQTGE